MSTAVPPPIEWWQQSAFKQWQKVIKEDCVPHASLIFGAPGLGKKSLVKAILREMMCMNLVEEGACGACTVCQKIMSNDYPDVKWLVPEAPGKALKIDDIREAIEWLQLSPLQSSVKVFVIQNAENLNTAASNALLKILEEPPPTGLIFLISEMPTKLAPTIRSRCQNLSILMPDAAFIKAWMKQKLPDTTTPLPLFPGLGPFALLAEYEEEKTKVRDMCFQTLHAVENQQMDFVTAQEQLKKLDPQEVLRYVYYYLHHASENALVKKDQKRLKALLALEKIWFRVKTNFIHSQNLNWPLQLDLFLNQLGHLHAAR